MRKRKLIWALVVLPLGLLPAGCERYGEIAEPGIDTLSVAMPAFYESATASLFLYRITSRDSGKRLGIGREFEVEERRDVRSVVKLEGLEGNEPLQLHIMYLNPMGKEMYTKEIRVERADWTSPEKRQALAETLVQLDPERGLCEVEARYGVGPDKYDREAHKAREEKDFRVGTWHVRVYLFRLLLMETSFELSFEEG